MGEMDSYLCIYPATAGGTRLDFCRLLCLGDSLKLDCDLVPIFGLASWIVTESLEMSPPSTLHGGVIDNQACEPVKCSQISNKDGEAVTKDSGLGLSLSNLVLSPILGFYV